MYRSTLALATMIAAAPVLAEPVVLHNFSHSYAAMTIAPLPGTEWVGVGQFAGERNGGAPNSFLTFCTDLYQSFNWNLTYNDYEVVANGSAHGLTTTQVGLIGKLYSAAGAIDSTIKSVAFQLDVWEIVNDPDPFDVTIGTFKVTGGGTAAQKDLANQWLAVIHATSAGNHFEVQRLYSPTAQDFLVVQPALSRQRQAVPEPASIALVGAALAGLLLATRRRDHRR